MDKDKNATEKVAVKPASAGVDSQASERLADLAAIKADAAGDPAQVKAAQEAGPNLAAEIVGLVTVMVAALGPMFPSLPKTYTPEITKAAAESVARVCEKHGWLQGGIVGNWGEEIAAAAILGPLAYQTAQGIKADIEARKPKKEESKPVPVTGSAPGKGVTFGTVEHVMVKP